MNESLFEFNVAQTRLEIKTLVDAFMEGVLADNNVIDQTNNDIDNIENKQDI
jgi:hypothetical protein